MSNFLRRFSKEKKNYKELYETELHNRKMYEQRYKEKCKENIALQKEKGIDKLRLELMKVSDELDQTKNELSFVKEDRAKLYVELEDARNELELLKHPKKHGRKKKVD